MKTNKLIFLSLLSFCFVVALALVLSGCKKKEEPAPVTQKITIDNLQTAYGASVKRVTWYKRFVAKAEKERLTNVANLFKAVIRSEEIRAANHAKLIKSFGVEPQQPIIDSIAVGTTLQALKMATSTEGIQAESMYPNLLRTAEVEQVADAILQFKQARDGDARHHELFKEAEERMGNIPKLKYFICPECGYILTSEKTEECPVCHTKKDKFEKI
ncbi:MAG: rubrerythrin family protein [Ignavibacteriales bacterium]|nr:rubrerythrin family protein [Ignavibacteriales bacterium]